MDAYLSDKRANTIHSYRDRRPWKAICIRERRGELLLLVVVWLTCMLYTFGCLCLLSFLLFSLLLLWRVWRREKRRKER